MSETTPNTRRTPDVRFVIPCGKDKLDHAAPAAELYTSSTFRMALAAALAEVDGDRSKVLVLSAAHGLVTLDTVLDPYNVRMGDVDAIDETALELSFLVHGLHLDGVDVYAMLPSAYFGPLDTVARRWFVWIADVYEACGGIGDQRHVMSVVAA